MTGPNCISYWKFYCMLVARRYVIYDIMHHYFRVYKIFYGILVFRMVITI